VRIDPAALSNARRYYLMISCIIPRPIAWIGSYNEDGSGSLAPFSYFNGFCSAPPLVGVGFAPHEDKGEKDTLRNIRRSGELSINLATVDMAPQVIGSSADFQYGVDEFERLGVSSLACEKVNAPRVAQSPVSFECSVYELKPLGTEGACLLLAEIRLFHILDTLLNEYGTVDSYRFNPLARLGGITYAGLAERFDLQPGSGSSGG